MLDLCSFVYIRSLKNILSFTQAPIEKPKPLSRRDLLVKASTTSVVEMLQILFTSPPKDPNNFLALPVNRAFFSLEPQDVDSMVPATLVYYSTTSCKNVKCT